MRESHRQRPGRRRRRCAIWRSSWPSASRKRWTRCRRTPPARLQRLMDYEFLDQEARDAFQELVDELRQKMLGDQFRMMQQGLERMTPEDLGPMREMVAGAQPAPGQARCAAAPPSRTSASSWSASATSSRDDIDSIEDLVEYLEQQAAQMASLLASMPEEMRRQLEETMQALLQDDQLQCDLMQMADLIEQITGRPLGRRYPFSGDTPVGFDEALDIMRGPQRGRRAGAPAAQAHARARLRQRRRGPAAPSCWARTPPTPWTSMRRLTELLRGGRPRQARGQRHRAHGARRTPPRRARPAATSSPSCGRTASASTTQPQPRRQQRAGLRDQALGVRRPLPRRHRHQHRQRRPAPRARRPGEDRGQGPGGPPHARR